MRKEAKTECILSSAHRNGRVGEGPARPQAEEETSFEAGGGPLCHLSDCAIRVGVAGEGGVGGDADGLVGGVGDVEDAAIGEDLGAEGFLAGGAFDDKEGVAVAAGGDVDDEFPEVGADFGKGVGAGVPVVEVADDGDMLGVAQPDADGVGD